MQRQPGKLSIASPDGFAQSAVMRAVLPLFAHAQLAFQWADIAKHIVIVAPNLRGAPVLFHRKTQQNANKCDSAGKRKRHEDERAHCGQTPMMEKTMPRIGKKIPRAQQQRSNVNDHVSVTPIQLPSEDAADARQI